MDDTADAIRDFFFWFLVPPLAAKQALDKLDDMLAGEE